MTSKFIATFLALALALSAQDKNFFPKPSYFRETFAAPRVSKIELLPPARLSDYVTAGKLELSLRSYLELVMANNTDVAISRLSVEAPRNAILRAFAPFDPLATASFNSTRTKSLPTDALAGASTLQTLSQPFNIGFQQTLAEGTRYSIGYVDTKSTSNSGFQNFNPSFNSSLAFNFTQPLIRNRGAFVNRIPIMVAQSRLRKAEYDLSNTLLGLVNTAEIAYWQAVQFRENLRVQEASLHVADEFLKRSQRELELGAISKLDVYQPELQFVQAQASVTQARYQVLQQDDTLRKQIGADLDPAIRALPIVLTEDMAVPAQTAPLDPEALIAKALLMRPDLKSQTQDLDVDNLQIRSVTNAMRPDLSLTGQYVSQGRGGTAFIRQNVFNDVGASSTVTSILPGGFGDAFTQMFGFGYPVYGLGLRLTLPIRNRQASADMADALVSKRMDTLQVRTTEQTIRLDVLTAINQVESSRAAYDLAVRSRDFAKLALDAENRKYELGTSQIQFVLTAQNNLTQADSNVVVQSIGYRRNMLNLLRVVGSLLDDRGIAVK